MTDQSRPRATPSPVERKQGPTAEEDSEDKRVRDILEKARQNVKSLAKDALAGEAIDTELLNFRMRGN